MSDLGDTFATIVTDGSLLLAAAIAALVGLISFASPCVLPLVPGYLAYVAGLTGSESTAAAQRPVLGARRALTLSAWARRHAPTVMRIGGGLLIVLGVLLVTGGWDVVMTWLRSWLATTGLGTSAV